MANSADPRQTAPVAAPPIRREPAAATAAAPRVQPPVAGKAPAVPAPASGAEQAKAPRPTGPTLKAVPATPAQPPKARKKAPLPAARLRLRHLGLAGTFVLLVLLPTFLSAAYLWLVAKDQYASTIAFSVRREETPSADLLGGLSMLAGSSGSDTDILYDFLRSQELVARIDERLDLRSIYARAWPGDPVFAFNPSGRIEDLHSQWLSMVSVDYDGSTGLITLQSRAFDPAEAKAVAVAAFEESSRMINALSDTARADATRYTQADLDAALERLKASREALTAFRLRAQIIDISSDIQSQMGIVSRLQEQLASVLVETDILRETTRPDDPRIAQAEQRIRVIEERIAEERAKFGSEGTGPGGEAYAALAAEYERLTVDLEFAEQTYRTALAANDAAKANAQRQSRYLAAHISPTLAEQSLYPNRMVMTGLVGFFLLAAWSVIGLIYYSVRDRR